MCSIRHRIKSVHWGASEPNPSGAAKIVFATDTYAFAGFPSHCFGDFCRDFGRLFGRELCFAYLILLEKRAVIEMHNQVRLLLNHNREVRVRNERMLST